MNSDDIHNLIAKNDHEQYGIMGILQDIQARYSYLPEEALKIVAEQTNHSLADIYGVATFYKSFSLKQRGKHLCSVCLGTACHVRGAPRIEEEFQRQLAIKTGETTEDREISLETVNCLGACALGPIVVVDGHYFPNVNKTIIKEIIRKTRDGLDRVEVKTDRRVFPVEVSCSRCNHSLMEPGHLIDGHPAIRVTISSQRRHGWLRMSCLYGSHTVESEYEMNEDELHQFFCPHCHAELAGASDCGECGAPMVPMILRGGGIIQICSRRGCKGHLLDVD